MKSTERRLVPTVLVVLMVSLTLVTQGSASVDRMFQLHATAQMRSVRKPEEKKDDNKDKDDKKDDKKGDDSGDKGEQQSEQKKCRTVRYICGYHKECPDGNDNPCWDVPDWCTKEECN